MPREQVFFREQLDSGQVFAAWERLHDFARTGFRWRAQENVTRVVTEALLAAEAEVDSFVVMPNHVHVLWTPRVSLAKLMQRVKAGSTTEVNRILGRQGERFWQEEYFDRLVRTGEEALRIRRYIEMNPVKARLVNTPEGFPWSSAAWRRPRGNLGI